MKLKHETISYLYLFYSWNSSHSFNDVNPVPFISYAARSNMNSRSHCVLNNKSNSMRRGCSVRTVKQKFPQKSLLVECKPPPARSDIPSSTVANDLLLASLASKTPLVSVQALKYSLLTVYQQHSRLTFTVFCRRPVSSGQEPSLVRGTFVLFEMGGVTLRDENSGKIALWNGQKGTFHSRSSDSAVTFELESWRLDSTGLHGRERLPSFYAKVLPLCLGFILNSRE